MHDYPGNLHIHSKYSDGSGTVEEIAAAAGRAGLDWIILTDHNTLAPLRDGKEGWYGRVLVLIGCEINLQNNHYLAFGLRDEVPPDDADPQRVIDGVHAGGGFGFIAHPDDVGSPFDSDGHGYTWTDWSVRDYDGMELWNFTSHWKAPVQSLARGLWHWVADFDGFVGTPPATTVARWRRACLDRPVPAIGTSDAHSQLVKAGPFRFVIFPYEQLFRRITTHLLLPHRLTQDRSAEGLARDKQSILDALRSGHAYISDRGAGDPAHFVMRMTSASATAGPGESIRFEPGMELEVSLQEAATIRIWKDERVVRELRARQFTWAIDGPGVFGVEILRRHRIWSQRTWILSNPVYVRPSGERASRGVVSSQ